MNRTVTHLDLPASSPGTRRRLTIKRYGTPGARPKVYLHAALHADEIPGLLVLNKLAEHLDAAADAGDINGEIVLIPVANPIGLAQYVNGYQLGRYALDGSGNFNRGYPEIADAVAQQIEPHLSPDATANIATIRSAMNDVLDKLQAADELDFLRLSLMRLAIDADFALDLHCDSQAVLHLYTAASLWPGAADLSAQLGSRATLLADESGGNPFDEALSRPWLSLAKQFPNKPIPPACLAATVELRGESEVSEALATADADNLYRFMQRRGVIAGDPGPLPQALCQATPFEGVDTIEAPHTGIVSFECGPGDQVAKGDVVAVLIDPLTENLQAARTELTTCTSGIVFSRRSDRLARPGQTLCRVAGEEPLPHRIGKHLLGD